MTGTPIFSYILLTQLNMGKRILFEYFVHFSDQSVTFHNWLCDNTLEVTRCEGHYNLEMQCWRS